MQVPESEERRREAISKLFLDDITDITEADYHKWLIMANRQNGKSAAIEAIAEAAQKENEKPKPNRAMRRAKGDRRGFLGLNASPHSPGNIGERVVW